MEKQFLYKVDEALPVPLEEKGQGSGRELAVYLNGIYDGCAEMQDVDFHRALIVKFDRNLLNNFKNLEILKGFENI